MVSKDLIILNSPINTTLGALSANVAIVLATVFGTGLAADFWAVGARISLCLSGTITGGQPVLIGLANGSADVSEIVSGLTSSESVDPFDASAQDDQGRQKIVIQQSLRVIQKESPSINEFIKFGRKGMVLRESKGIVPFAKNVRSAAMTTGAEVSGQVTYFGRWLSG